MRQELLDIWTAGVDAVRGETAMRMALDAGDIAPVDRILAVGKAASDMARAAMERYPDAPTLIVTKHGHASALPRAAQVIEAGHPVPDAASLTGGRALLEAVQACGPRDHLLLLVSGGASAVAELLPAGLTLADWQMETQRLVASGADIHAINTRRKEISRIKGGKLLSGFKGARATSFVISDVQGDDLNVVGSGIGAGPDTRNFAFSAKMIATNAHARHAAAQASPYPVIANREALYADIYALAPQLGQELRDGPSGLYIFGGEPTTELPDSPGRGGRNQALALLMAREIAGREDIDVLVAGTDGSDGPTGDAGGYVSGHTWGAGAKDALERADAGTYLDAQNALVTTGPTGTNVMDLMIALKR